MNQQYYIGIMSGTSLDGCDCILTQFPTLTSFKIIATYYEEYSKQFTEELINFIQSKTVSFQQYGEIDQKLGKFFGECILKLITRSQIDKDQIIAIGVHGQTIWHSPLGDYPFSIQIGNANLIAKITNLPVITDFRQMDIVFGGQGAPLAPIFHHNFFYSKDKIRAIANIGGISNITLLNSADPTKIIGYDTGPGNILMNAWAQLKFKESFDKDGQFAKQGSVNNKLLELFLLEKFFSLPPPKSTGRELFCLDWVLNKLHIYEQTYQETLNDFDIMATLLKLTAFCIASVLKPFKIQELFVCGGGAKNKVLLESLKNEFENQVFVDTTQYLSLDPDWVEAALISYLAKLTIEGKPGNLPSVTGACQQCVLGGFYCQNGIVKCSKLQI